MLANQNKKIIAVAMSGGVDSSVTAALLKNAGHQVIGITMQLFKPQKSGSGTAAYDAALVADFLGIPHHLVDFGADFQRLIIDDFADEYRHGQTPNPCIRCNRYIKFGLLLEKALELGADMLATGHYVKKSIDELGVNHLCMAKAAGKDQSYFLYTLTAKQLEQVIFPLGEFESKDDVRRLARELKLPVAEKSDSQEVCFIPDDDYAAFLETGCGVSAEAGDIFHVGGSVIGRHKGTHRYTVGQRKGLGIAWSKPLYVIAIDAAKNIIVVGEKSYLSAGGLLAENVSWVVTPVNKAFVTTCKIRYRHQPVGCLVKLLDDDRCEVIFDKPQKSVTPGQSVVFYSQNELLGGGKIVSGIVPDIDLPPVIEAA